MTITNAMYQDCVIVAVYLCRVNLVPEICLRNLATLNNAALGALAGNEAIHDLIAH